MRTFEQAQEEAMPTPEEPPEDGPNRMLCPGCDGEGLSKQVYQRPTGGLDRPMCKVCRGSGYVATDHR